MSDDHQNNTSDESKLDGAGPTPQGKANAASPSTIRGGGKGKPPRKPPVASSGPSPRRRGGYKTPPVDRQFKPGQSGNPNGRRKKPKLPRHVGNQINAVTAAIITELNHIMMHGLPTKPPKGPYAGAKLFARMFFRDATTKDGYRWRRDADGQLTRVTDAARASNQTAGVFRYDMQGNRCALTGIPFHYASPDADKQLLPSADRKDSSGHYVQGNIQVVCRFVNFWKNAQSNDEFIRLISMVRGTSD